jgi:hypothetical protein
LPDAYRSGVMVVCSDLQDGGDRWPNFAPAATATGYRSVLALPMRLRNNIIGALNLIRVSPGELDVRDIKAAQALADVATIGILHHRVASESDLLTDQLQYALNSRIVIEQAKGMVSHRFGLDMDHALASLRHYSRDNNQRPADVAEESGRVLSRVLSQKAHLPGSGEDGGGAERSFSTTPTESARDHSADRPSIGHAHRWHPGEGAPIRPMEPDEPPCGRRRAPRRSR